MTCSQVELTKTIRIWFYYILQRCHYLFIRLLWCSAEYCFLFSLQNNNCCITSCLNIHSGSRARKIPQTETKIWWSSFHFYAIKEVEGKKNQNNNFKKIQPPDCYCKAEPQCKHIQSQGVKTTETQLQLILTRSLCWFTFWKSWSC